MNNCTNPHLTTVLISLLAASHSITLFVDYWMGVTEKFESNSIVQLILKVVKNVFKKKEISNGK